jgi:hypothetical protein
MVVERRFFQDFDVLFERSPAVIAADQVSPWRQSPELSYLNTGKYVTASDFCSETCLGSSRIDLEFGILTGLLQRPTTPW